MALVKALQLEPPKGKKIKGAPKRADSNAQDTDHELESKVHRQYLKWGKEALDLLVGFVARMQAILWDNVPSFIISKVTDYMGRNFVNPESLKSVTVGVTAARSRRAGAGLVSYGMDGDEDTFDMEYMPEEATVSSEQVEHPPEFEHGEPSQSQENAVVSSTGCQILKTF